MSQFATFFIILLAALFSSEIARKFKVPWVVMLIIGGMLIGPFGCNIFEITPTIDFLGEIGLVFLMFIAGLETRLSSFKEFGKNIVLFAGFNALIPLIVGIGIGILFGYSFTASLLIGIIFMSSSVAIVIPSLESNNLLETKLGKTILAGTVIEDVASLVFFSMVLQTHKSSTFLPLPLVYIFLILGIVLLRWMVKKLHIHFMPNVFVQVRDSLSNFFHGEIQQQYQRELRLVIVLLIGTVLLFEALGLHQIIAGFFAGVVLSELVSDEVVKGKIRAISYGLFIPIFFIVIGAETNMSIFLQAGSMAILAVSILIASVGSKFVSGFIATKLSGFSFRESFIAGGATIPQLSTTLAVAFVGFESGLFEQPLLVALVMLSIVTTFISPFVVLLGNRSR